MTTQAKIFFVGFFVWFLAEFVIDRLDEARCIRDTGADDCKQVWVPLKKMEQKQ